MKFQIRNRFGEGLKGFGRDGGGRKEGRRNFIDNKEYIAEDGTKRLRIRFNIEGPHGNAAVFAEVRPDNRMCNIRMCPTLPCAL